MTDGWQTKQIGELCDVLDYKRKPITKRDRIVGDYPYYGATGVLGHVEGYLFDEPLVLVGEDGAKWESGENTAYAVEGKIWVNNHAHVLRPHRTRLLDKWLIYHLNHSDLTEFVSGLTVPKLNQGSLREIPVPLPPLPEQQRIVGILDKAFDGIATAKSNAEKNLQNARALFESHLQAVFTQRGKGWVEKRLGEVCDLQNGYAFKSSDYIESSNTLNIRMSNIRPGGSFDSEHNQIFLPDSYAKNYAAFLLKEGDLIIAMTDMAGDPKILGVPTLVSNQNGRNFLMNQRVGKLFGFSDDVRVPYLRYYLTSPSIKQFYKSKGAGGLQINISKGDILSANIPLPTIAIQNRIVDQLDSLNEETQRLTTLYQHKLDALEALKQSLLHEAFAGHL